MVPTWRKSLSRLRRAAACPLIVLACCSRREASVEVDAAVDDAASRSPSDAAGVPTDGLSAEQAVGDGTLSSSPSDSGGAPVDEASAEAQGDSATAVDVFDSEGSRDDGASSAPTGPCNAIVEARPIEGYAHVAVCSHVTYLAKPPSSGDHYPIWAAYQSYATAIPEGFWVHNLEHGAVVLSYNCPGGCAADVTAAQSWMDGLPDDPSCVPPAGDARIRIVMTPDPNLDVKFAASSWGWTLRADCFDPASFGAFVQAHYGQGREAICAQGQDLSMGVQDGCGE